MKTLGEMAVGIGIFALFLLACCVLLPVLWMLPRWVRRFRFRLEWRRIAPSRSYWRDHPAGPLAEWENEARRG